MYPNLSRVTLPIAALLLAGCATVKSSHVAPDYATRYQRQVKRLVVLTAPLPEGDPALASMWNLIAKRYVNQKFDYIAKATAAGPQATGAQAPAALCASMSGDQIEGVLWLAPTASRQGAEVKASVEAKLLACPNASEVWAARGEGSWASKDDELRQFTADYVREIGPGVEPYVAPTFRLLKGVLDTLPHPTLTEDEKDEKISVISE